MSLSRIALAAVAALAIGAAAWVRLAPTDPPRWHQRPDAPLGDTSAPGAFIAVRAVADPAATLAEADRVIRATPRTHAIAGGVAEGMVTYQTRSALWGFPDYTTVWAGGDRIGFHGRLRYGGSDMGVNERRIRGWLDRLGLGS